MMCAIDVTPTLATERLLLRGPVISDADRLADLANDPGVAAMTCNMPHPYGLAQAEAFIQRSATRDWDREPSFVIEHRNFGLVGGLGFKTAASGRPEIGYWLGRPFWNRGYATEAARAALDWARRDWRKKLVVAGHFADNPASGQVLCKAGFLYTGDVEQRWSQARGGPAKTRMMVWLA
ncbi:MAG: acetyltransferase, family [Phenylobacterium sp.]|nr:acetyltransferase, family [Phenylobacterium sp.]